MNRYVSILPVVACIFMMIALNGCATKVHTEIIKPPLNLPTQVYQCDDATARPKGDAIMESDVARYVASLESVNKNCKVSLKEIKIIIDCYNDKDCNVDKLIEYEGLIQQAQTK